MICESCCAHDVADLRLSFVRSFGRITTTRGSFPPCFVRMSYAPAAACAPWLTASTWMIAAICSWTLETDPEEAAEAFAGWDPRLVERIRLVTTSLRGAVFVRSGLEHWSIGRVTLLGDAAHAMEPFQAQGAAQAVEDAYVLATCVAAHDGEGTPRASTRTSIGSLAGCHACERNENIPALPNWDRALVTDHWRLAHAWSALPGWLVLLPLRHVKALDELTNREAAEIGPLLRTTTAALRDVVGCTKSYVMLFAELEGHEHLHFHIVPRMPEFTDEQIGARVFTFLRRPESEWVPEPQRNRLAREIGALVRTRLERLS